MQCLFYRYDTFPMFPKVCSKLGITYKIRHNYFNNCAQRVITLILFKQVSCKRSVTKAWCSRNRGAGIPTFYGLQYMIREYYEHPAVQVQVWYLSWVG